MAYGIKYQFSLESINGATYTVNISKDGYSGDVIKRPLGKSPVLTKNTNGCIHSTTLDLVLECHVDGEFSEFYNATPGEYLVSLFKGNAQIWQGSLVTELYSAPEIAPPYDVKISANDGIALAKEFVYVAQGAITPKALVRNLLADVPGLGRSIYIVSGIGATDLSADNFWNTALINLDYKAGESKYDVLTYFLDTIHATITTHDGNWLIVRETDVTVSSGSVPCLLAPRNSSSISSSSLTGVVKSAGQMGVADLWPVGHMSTNVSPAKRRVTIEAPFHSASGAPSVASNGWSIYDSSHATFSGGSYILTYATNDDDYGEVYAQIPIRSFTKDLKLSIKVSTYLAYVYVNQSDLKIYVTFTPTGGSPMYYNGLAWSSSSAVFANPELTKPVGTVESPEDFSFDISPLAEFAGGTLDITFIGRRVRLYDAVLETIIGKGYKDTIVINNGARGDGDTTEIAGSRVSDGDVVSPAFLQGIFLYADESPVEGFFDNNFSGPLSFMSLTAMGYALSVALPRLDLSGTFNVPTSVTTIPLIITYGGVNYWVESYDLNVLEEELKLTARSLPSATLSVESETITELTDEDARGGSSSGGGGGGGGGGSYTLPIASASTLGGIRVGTGLSIDGQTGVLTANGGGYTLPIASANTLGGIKVGSGLSINALTGVLSALANAFNGGEITQDLWLHTGGSDDGSTLFFGDKDGNTGYAYIKEDSDDHLTIYGRMGVTIAAGEGGSVVIQGLSIALGDLSGVSISSPSNGQALVYRNGSWHNETIQGGGTYILPEATAAELGGIKVGFVESGKNYPVELDDNGNAYVNVPWSSGGGGGGDGTVTSVAMTVPTGFSVTGSPVTTSGTLAVSLDSQAKNKVLASPTSAAGVPSFRVLDASDIPNLDASKINAGTLDAARIPDLSASKITSGTLDAARIPNLDASKITSGTFAAARIPDLSSKYVTLDTTQNNISGEKTFTTKPVHIGSSSGIDVDGSSYIDIGDARLKWDASTHSLHVTKRPGSSYSGNINVYADGDVGAGGPGSGSSVKYVNCANQSAYDSISPKDPATIYTIGTASSPSKIYLGSVQIH